MTVKSKKKNRQFQQSQEKSIWKFKENSGKWEKNQETQIESKKKRNQESKENLGTLRKFLEN